MNQATIKLFVKLSDSTGKPLNYRWNYPEQNIDRFRQELERSDLIYIEALRPDRSVTFIY